MGYVFLDLSDQCGDRMGWQNLGKWGKKYFLTILSFKVDVFCNLSSCFGLVWFGYVFFVFVVKF